MRELIDVLFWYSGCGFWSALTCFLLYRLHHLLIDKKVRLYILIKNLIEFPFIMLWIRFWNEKQLTNSHNMLEELKKDEKHNMNDIYFLTRIGFNYTQYRYNRIKK